MFKNVATKIALFAFDTTTGAPKTGDAANISAYVSKDYGAVTQLADTSATEMDATNAKGMYLFDVAQAESNGDALIFSGKSSTANISIVPVYIHTTPNRFTTLVIDAAGLADANAVKVGPTGAGTAQTARDVGATLGVAGAGLTALGDTRIVNLDAAISSRTKPADTQAAVTTVTNLTNAPTVGDLTSTMKTSVQTAADAAVTANALINTIAGYIDTEVAAIKAKTDNLPVDPADASDIAASFASVASTLSTIASYIDTEVAAIYTRIGAPIGASIAADIAALPVATRDVNNTSPASGSLGAKVNSAASAGDPWATSLPGSYGNGTAGKIVGTNLDAPVSSVGGGTPPSAATIAAAVADEVLAGHTTAGTLGKTLTDISSVLAIVPYKQSSVDDSSPTVGGFIGAAGLSATNNFYAGCLLTFMTGALQGITRSCTTYDGSTFEFTFSGATGQADAPWPAAPANTDEFIIMGRAE